MNVSIHIFSVSQLKSCLFKISVPSLQTVNRKSVAPISFQTALYQPDFRVRSTSPHILERSRNHADIVGCLPAERFAEIFVFFAKLFHICTVLSFDYAKRIANIFEDFIKKTNVSRLHLHKKDWKINPFYCLYHSVFRAVFFSCEFF